MIPFPEEVDSINPEFIVFAGNTSSDLFIASSTNRVFYWCEEYSCYSSLQIPEQVTLFYFHHVDFHYPTCSKQNRAWSICDNIFVFHFSYSSSRNSNWILWWKGLDWMQFIRYSNMVYANSKRLFSFSNSSVSSFINPPFSSLYILTSYNDPISFKQSGNRVSICVFRGELRLEGF